MSETQFITELNRYINRTLHNSAQVCGVGNMPGLPAFLRRTYKFYESRIAGRKCVFLVGSDNAASPAEIAKHVGLVRSAGDDAVVAFAAQSLSAHSRARLIGQGVPFVVPGNQLYLPDLAMDLKERFRAPRQRNVDGLPPAAQAVLFHHLLQIDKAATTPSVLAARLRYSAMSIGRALDALAATGLARAEQRGRERHIRFNREGRKLFDAMRGLLRSPVRSRKFVKGKPPVKSVKLAGESALANLTELSAPLIETFAVAAADWKKTVREYGLAETDRYEADCIVETWAYHPSGLSDASAVDPLSLYAQFHDSRDERVSMAAGGLLGKVAW